MDFYRRVPRQQHDNCLLRILPASIQLVIVGMVCLASVPASAQEDEEVVPELSQVGALIDFARDVQPILADKCLSCHGPEEAKNDFRVDEAESLLSYIEPGDVESSSLWSDYLVTDDPDMRMPPTSVSHEELLTGVELATIKLWIEEGGMWNALSPEPVVSAATQSLSMPARVWRFQGLFHPATTHFPIALLTISAFFVLLSFVRPATCEPVAFHCLWIGAAGAIIASVAGWAYAVHEGYPASASFNLQTSAIDRHRWLGIAVTTLALILIPVAVYVRRKEDTGMRFVWLLGSLLLLGAVGTTGYQGGELTYGEGHYEQEFVKLFPEAFPTEDELVVDVNLELEEETVVDGATESEIETNVKTVAETDTASDTQSEAAVEETSDVEVENNLDSDSESDSESDNDAQSDVVPEAESNVETPAGDSEQP